MLLVMAGSLWGQVRTVWLNEYNGPADNEDVGAAVALDSGRNVIVCGWSTGATTGRDVLVVKYDRTGKLLWTRTYDGPANGDEYCGDIVIDSNDNIFVNGWSDGGSTLTDMIVLKYAPDGTLLWDNRFNGPANGHDYMSLYGAMAVDAAGDAYAVGYSQTTAGHWEFVTIKYLADGTEDWVQNYTGPNPSKLNSYGYALALAPSGYVYACGDTANLAGDYDYTIVKYDAATGALVWDRQFDGVYGLDESVYDVVLDSSENIYLAGISDTAGGHEYCTVKYDSGGVFQWEGRYGGTAGYHYGWIIDVDDAGSSYVSGFSMTGGGQYNIATVKYDTNGVRQWNRSYSNTYYFGEDKANHLKVGPNGNCYVTGYIWDGYNTSFDAVTLKYDPNGTLQWDQVHNGPGSGEDSGLGIAVDDDANVYVAGLVQGLGTGADVLTIKYSQWPAPALTVTPDPLQAGLNADFAADNFEPLTETYLAYSLTGTGNVYVYMLNIALGLAQPKQLGSAKMTDGAGHVDWTFPVPVHLTGTNVWFQAAQYNQVTDVVATSIQ
jgi:hypothetical protein